MHPVARCGLPLLAALTLAPTAMAGEIMIDRCSREVAFPPAYSDGPGVANVIVLKRGSNGRTRWSDPFTVKLGPGGHIRWWCHSTTGNWIDPGTWRITSLQVGTKCSTWADGQVAGCSPTGDLSVGSSAWNGWTPERSRCANRANRIRAMLDGNRTLRIECLAAG